MRAVGCRGGRGHDRDRDPGAVGDGGRDVAEPGEGPPFLAAITENGLFLAFTALVASLPVFLPLAVSVVAGEAVAGSAIRR